MKARYTILLLGLAYPLTMIGFSSHTSAQAINKNSDIIIQSFDGFYHLSRDANNRSLLTTEEVIVADFPSSNSFFGITREIPRIYQGRDVEVKVLKISDAAGNTIPFKTVDKGDNLLLTVGDPAIALYGSQTFKISYQAKGVVNITDGKNEFLLNVNGRGWKQPIGVVRASVYIPKNFQASLTSKPTCYVGFNNLSLPDCEVNQRTGSSELIISAKSLNSVEPHHGLVLQLSFKPATFSNKTLFWTTPKLALAGSAMVLATLSGLWVFKKKI